MQMQIKYGSSFCLFLLLPVFCLSQSNRYSHRDSTKVLNAYYHYFDLIHDKHDQAKPLPVSNIRFVDMRYDTTFLALNWHPGLFRLKQLKHKYTLTGGLAAYLTNYYRQLYVQDTTSDDNVLICFIKQFSITPKRDVLRYFMQQPSLTDVQDNNINVDMECFYRHGDTLYPAMQLDTTYLAHFLIKQTQLPDVVEDMLRPFEKKLEHADISNILKRKHYDETTVWSHYIKRFELPVLTTNDYKKGIYKNITELRNQTPSIDSFFISVDKIRTRIAGTGHIDSTLSPDEAVQKRKSGVFLYDANNELINPSDVFAYCSDGETLWIQHGASYYPLVKTGNSFEFIYIYHYQDINENQITVSILMPLDMETGQSN